MTGSIACKIPFWKRILWAVMRAAATVREEGAENKEKEQNAVNQQAERLLDSYGNSILRYAYTYLHNREDAEEILQETLIRFLQTKPLFVSAEHEKAWLLRVAGNLSKNKLRAEKVRQTDELKEELVAQQREDLAFVWEAVSRLPEKQRQAVHLFYHEGYSTRQIAQILEKNEATVRSDLGRAREKLRKILKEEYGLEAAV